MQFSLSTRPDWKIFTLLCMADNPYWGGKVHKTVKLGGSFDPRSVERRKRAGETCCAVSARKAEIEALREKQSPTVLGAILNLVSRSVD
jgi:hypothetical protein